MTQETAHTPDPRRWFTLAIVLIGFLMILIDTTVVNVSIPTIIKDLGASLSQIEWVISGYSLVFAALLITFGRLGDMYGRRFFFLLGLGLFGLASLLCGEATTPGILIAARLFQGVGGAIISPSVLSIISSTFKDRERAIAFGMFGAVSGTAVALGPILGGWLTTYYNWRWIFRINIPIAIIGIALGMLYIKESHDPRKQKLDLTGMLTSALASFFLVFGLIEGATYGWWAQKAGHAFQLGSWMWPTDRLSIIPYSFLLGVISLITFITIQSRKTKAGAGPAVDLNLFQSRAFRFGLIAISIIALGEFSSLFTLPIFLQSVHGFTPLQSGLGTLPLALTMMIAAPLSATIVNRVGSKWIISTGIFLEFIGLMTLSTMKFDSAYIALVPGLIILGAGIGLAIAQNTQVTLSEIDPRESGAASGVLNTIRQLGTAFGIAIVGAVVTTQLTTQLTPRLTSVQNLPTEVRQNIEAAAADSGVTAEGSASQEAPVPAAIADNPAAVAQFKATQQQVAKDVKTAVDKSLTSAIVDGIRTGATFVFFGALLSLLIPNVKQRPHGKPEEAVAAGH